MPDNDTPKNPWLDRVPELADGRRFPSMAPDAAAQLFDELLAADPKEIAGIIDSLREVDDGGDWKARFILGALASHSGGREGAARKLEAIYARALQGDRPAPIKTFLAMQLQWFAGAGAVPALVAQLRAEHKPLADAAAAALVAIGKPADKALRDAGRGAEGHARITIDHALKQLGRSA